MASTQKPLSFSLGPLNTKYILDLVAKQKLINSRYSRSMYMDDLITHLRTKAKPVKKKKTTELVPVKPIYPVGLNIQAWEAWIEFRNIAKFKKYKSVAPMNKLSTMGDYNEQALIVKQSIDNEYQGLFELKTGAKKAPQVNDEIMNDTSWADSMDDVL